MMMQCVLTLQEQPGAQVQRTSYLDSILYSRSMVQQQSDDPLAFSHDCEEQCSPAILKHEGESTLFKDMLLLLCCVITHMGVIARILRVHLFV